MRHVAMGVLLVAILASCTQARTQLMLRVRTDMTQGPAAELAAIEIRVSDETAMLHQQRYPLEAGVTLPSTLGLVPATQRDALLTIEIDALGPGSALLFTHRVQARYVPERTLLVDVLLAGRCRDATARSCEASETCGATGCEPVLRTDLPDYDPDEQQPDASVPPVDADIGTDACLAMCDGACVDTSSDPANCGECDVTCAAPASHGAASCAAGECGFACESEHHVCGDDCVSDRSLSTCGTSCEPCQAPTTGNGVASCDGVRCGFRCDPGHQRTSDGCVAGPNVDPPRPIAPLGFSHVTSLRPTFRWALGPASDGALVQVCEDRACARVLVAEEVGAGATSVRLSEDIAAPTSGSRRVYYRLFGRSGPATGASPSATWSFVLPVRSAEHETAFGTVYDVNGDGRSDLAAGSEGDRVALYHGTPTGLSLVPGALTQAGGSQFGVAVSAVGDVDGDGYGDLVLGAPGFRRAYLYRGSAGGLGTTPLSLVGPSTATEFGRTVVAAGDVNGDGYADVLVGAPLAGVVALYYGGASPDSTADVMISGSATALFGASITSIGDVDGDGAHDFAIGAPGEGRVYLFRGGAGLPGTLADTAALAFLEGPAAAAYGSSIAGALDVDGDGRADLLVASPGAGAGEPGVRLYLGVAGGISSESAGDWTVPGAPSATTQFGASLHPSGDVNGDGYDDWVVGAPGIVRAFVYRGGPTPVTMPGAEYSSSAGSRFGSEVTSSGDVDGNGFADTIVGAPSSRAFYLYLHTASGLAASGTSYTDAATAGFGAALAWLQRRCSEEAI